MNATTCAPPPDPEFHLPTRVRDAQGDIRFFFDESILGLGKCLAYARDDVVFLGHPKCQVVAGVEDVAWLPVVAEQDWIVVLRDKRIRTRPNERNELAHHKLRLLVMTGSGQQSIWEQLRVFVQRWDNVQSIIEDEPGPWLYRLNKSGLTRGDYPAI